MPNSNPTCSGPVSPQICCDRAMPLQLTATLTNVSGCGALSGVSLTLNWQETGGGEWLGFTDVCGSTVHVLFQCGPTPNDFTIGPNGWGVYNPHPDPDPEFTCLHPFSGPLQPGATCNPINAVFSMGPYTIGKKCGCCAGNKNVTLDIVITE